MTFTNNMSALSKFARKALAPFNSTSIPPSPISLFPPQFAKDKFIFIHIPKCAGSSFLNSYLGYQLGHVDISYYQKICPDLCINSFKCAFVRNPIQRFISAYNHLNTCDLWPYHSEVSSLIQGRSKSLTDLAENIHRFPDILSLDWFRPQYEYITSDNIVAVDRVFKTESYQEAIQWMKASLNLDFHTTDSSVNRRAAVGLTYGNQEISAEGISNLRQLYWRDFTLFGYY